MIQPVEIKMIGQEYYGYYFGKLITKQRSIVKCLEKLYKYTKSQG